MGRGFSLRTHQIWWLEPISIGCALDIHTSARLLVIFVWWKRRSSRLRWAHFSYAVAGLLASNTIHGRPASLRLNCCIKHIWISGDIVRTSRGSLRLRSVFWCRATQAVDGINNARQRNEMASEHHKKTMLGVNPPPHSTHPLPLSLHRLIVVFPSDKVNSNCGGLYLVCRLNIK